MPEPAAAAALDDDVRALLDHVATLEACAARARQDREEAARAFADVPLPTLRGPLARLSKRLAVYQARGARDLREQGASRELHAIGEVARSLEVKCGDIARTHRHLRAVPQGLNQAESGVDDARLAQVHYELAIARATREVMRLARVLGSLGERGDELIDEARRREAKLQVERIDVMLADPAMGERERLLEQRVGWLAVSNEGRSEDLVASAPNDEEVAAAFIDKRAHLVALHGLIATLGTDMPRRWVAPRVSRPRDAEDWIRRFDLLAELVDGADVFVAGSTHFGEESALIRAFLASPAADRRELLIVAPRHWDLPRPDGEIHGPTLEREIAPFARAVPLSRLRPGERPQVVFIDTAGLLRAIFGLAHGAFIGGSLLASSGHNVCEPLVFGVPTWTGPNHHADVEGWDTARRALAPHLRVVTLESLEAMFTTWRAMIAEGAIEAGRAEVMATLDRYLHLHTDVALERTAVIDDGVLECGARFGTGTCAQCDDRLERCTQRAALRRFRMVSGTTWRWFVASFCERALRARREGAELIAGSVGP